MPRCSFPAFVALSVVLLSVVLLLPGTSAAEPVVPDLDPGDFESGAPIDNPYFPLVPGTVLRYAVEVDDDGDTVLERIEEFVTFEAIEIAGVTARVVRAREFEDDLLVEDTRDYFAQDKSGNVWYLGEDTEEIEYDDEGNEIGRDSAGSWRAGVNGAQAGFIMPAFPPQVGFEYFQEFAPNDEAVDQARIVSLNNQVTIDLGEFDDVLKVLEFTELEPGEFEHKLYAPGVGLVLIEEDLEDGVPQKSIPLVGVSVIPLPPAAWTGMATLSLLLAGKGVRALRGRRRITRPFVPPNSRPS
jgi:hypothetical protein